MKRIILASVSALALFSATGAVAAGSNSTITQNGIDNTTVVKQSGTDNDSTVQQGDSALGTSTNKGSVEITQIGEDSGNGNRRRGAGGVDAEGGNLVRSNFSFVTQKGAATLSKVVSYQKGDLNRSRIDQTGSSNDADLDQRGVFNNSEITQSGGSEADVKQRGAYGDNNSIIIQSGGGTATVTQDGDATFPTYFPSNDSRIEQVSDAEATVTQKGQQNSAVVQQRAGSIGAIASIDQTNLVPDVIDNNTALIDQSADATATTTQLGSNNRSDTFQYAGSTGSTSDVFQNGTGNKSFVYQGGLNNTSDVVQNGTNNSATVYQNVASPAS